MSELAEVIQKIAGTHLKDNVYTFDCTVLSVDENDFTCDVETINSGTDIPGVRLASESNDGFTIIPSVGSTVTLIASDQGEPYVAMFSDVEKVIVIIGDTKLIIKDGEVVYNNGLNGGVIKINELTAKMNARFALFRSAISAGFSALASIDSGASSAAFNSAMATDQPFNKTDYEDSKVKH